MPAELEILESYFEGCKQGEVTKRFLYVYRSGEGEVNVVVLTTVEVLSSGGKKHD